MLTSRVAAIAYILIELSQRSQSMIVDRAWRAIDGVFTEWGGAMEKTKKGMLWGPMRKLMARARKKREENMAMPQTQRTLGMDFKNVRPPPTGPSPGPIPIHPTLAADLARDRQRSLPKSAAELNEFLSRPPEDDTYDNENMLPPQIIGMGPTFAPDQIQLQLQQHQQQQIPQTSWLMDDNALLDLDMHGLESDMSWEGWDDLVKDFKMEEASMQPGEIRGPVLGVSEETAHSNLIYSFILRPLKSYWILQRRMS